MANFKNTTLGIVCGMRAEADIARGQGLCVVVAAGGRERAERMIAELVASGVSGLVSFGTAGALAPDLVSGDMVLGTVIADRVGAKWPVNGGYLDQLAKAIPNARRGLILGVDHPLLTTVEKSEAHRSTGALAVDMESHLAARAAVANGLPFATIRAILDDARTEIPAVLGDAIDGKGRARPWPIAAALLTGKVRMAELLVLSRGFARARAALLGGGAALASLGE